MHLSPQIMRLLTITLLMSIAPITSSAQAIEPPPKMTDSKLAEGFIRCETFYKHYYESLKVSNLSALHSPAIAKLPKVVRISRISAEALVGEAEAKAIYGKNLEAQLVEFTKASLEDWPSYANKMSAECTSLFQDNDTEALNERIKNYAKQKGIDDL